MTLSPEPARNPMPSFQSKTVLLALAVLAAGCTEARRERTGTTLSDKPADITCWSYGQQIYQGRSTGKVDGRSEGRVGFVDAANNRYTTVDGHCLIVYDR